eukprot:Sdes_comp16917_c0_seq1m6134
MWDFLSVLITLACILATVGYFSFREPLLKIWQSVSTAQQSAQAEKKLASPALSLEQLREKRLRFIESLPKPSQSQDGISSKEETLEEEYESLVKSLTSKHNILMLS